MNQRFSQQNMQGVRQISPEEIARAQGLSQAELQKTQVLNLKEVEDVARLEKLSSKKPAIIVAVIGILCITFGATFQVAQNFQGKQKEKVEKREITTEEAALKENHVANETILKCVRTNKNNPDGTDTVFTVTYTFSDNKLIKFIKNFHISVTPGSTTGPVTIQSYLNSYQAFLNQTEGYQISVNPLNNGVEVNVQVDYNTLDLTKLNPKQQEHASTKVDYPIDTLYDKIKTDSLAQNYICE